MLGRLEMDVESCIQAYLGMSAKIFGSPKKKNIFTSLRDKWNMIEKFDSTILEKCIKEIIKTKTGDEDTLMKQNNNPRCKV